MSERIDIDQIPSVWSVQDILNLPEPSSTGPWGKWRFKKTTNELVFQQGRYYVDLDDCKTSAAVLDWIFQLHGKAWMTDVDMRDLLRALRARLHPQQNLCSFGAEQSTVNPPTIEAYRTMRGSQLTFFCQHCLMWHYHGIKDGHRVAHCCNRDSPFKGTGYILRETGPITKEIIGQHKCKRGAAYTKPEIPQVST